MNNSDPTEDKLPPSTVEKESLPSSSVSLSKDFLKTFLQDPTNSGEFEAYLNLKGQSPFIEFLWALNGIKSMGTTTESEKLIKCIYTKYILNGVLLQALDSYTLLNLLGIFVNQGSSINELTHLEIFQQIANKVEEFLVETTFPSFFSFKKKIAFIKMMKSTPQAVIVNTNDDGMSYSDTLTIKNQMTTFISENNKSIHKKTEEEFVEELSSKLLALNPSSSTNECADCLQQIEKERAEFSKKLEEKLKILNAEMEATQEPEVPVNFSQIFQSQESISSKDNRNLDYNKKNTFSICGIPVINCVDGQSSEIEMSDNEFLIN